MMTATSPYDQNDPVFVAVDKDKHSSVAVRWAIDNLITNNQTLVLIHVRAAHATSADGSSTCGSDGDHTFALFRDLTPEGINVNEVVLDGTDVHSTILEYIKANHVTNISIGTSSRSALSRKFWAPDVATLINKSAPDYCTVYIISKGKPQIRYATRYFPGSNPPKPLSMEAASIKHSDSVNGSRRLSGYNHHDHHYNKWLRLSSLWVIPSRVHRNPSHSSSLDHDRPAEHIIDLQPSTHARVEAVESKNNVGTSAEDHEVQRLRQDVHQTMNMYNVAAKQAASSQHRANELEQQNQDENNRTEQSRMTEEAAFALVEMEKAKCRAAIKAAEKARKIAEREAQRRICAEQRAKREAEEKIRALDVLSQNDTRYRKYTIEEIQEATDKFSSSMEIGEGGYGPVYKGKLDHTPVAIKVLRANALQGRKQFHQEVEVLSCMRHPNMVILMGACPEYGCLVYEFMDNGSLEDRLFRRGNSPPIPWGIRFKLAADIATALLFLHQSKPEPLVHRDLKPANILLDRNYTCKLSDVGLARLVPPDVANEVTQYRMTAAAGTFCYIDPEYQQTGKLGTKSDIYSLGVTLLQVITAKPPMGLSHHVEKAIREKKLVDLLDPSVPDWPIEETLSFAKLAMTCVELRKKDRPDLANEILPELNRLKEFGMTHGLGQ